MKKLKQIKKTYRNIAKGKAQDKTKKFKMRKMRIKLPLICFLSHTLGAKILMACSTMKKIKIREQSVLFSQ
jgi:hypothetical protein